MTNTILPDKFTYAVNHEVSALARNATHAYSPEFSILGPKLITQSMSEGLLNPSMFESAKWYCLGVQAGVGICQSPTVPKISATKDQVYLRVIQAIFEELHDDLPATVLDTENHLAVCTTALEKASRRMLDYYQQVASNTGE
jgi:hypothetical protein